MTLRTQRSTLWRLESFMDMQELVVKMLNRADGCARIARGGIERAIDSGAVRSRTQYTKSTNGVQPVGILDTMQLNT